MSERLSGRGDGARGLARLVAGRAPGANSRNSDVLNEETPIPASAMSVATEEFHPLRARWLAGGALMAAAAALFLVEALYAAMDRNLRFAVAPAYYVAQTGEGTEVSGRLGDRVAIASAAHPSSDEGIKVEQLDSSGRRIRRFTHIVASLAELPSVSVAGPSPEAAPDADAQSGDATEDLGGADQSAASVAESLSAAAQLPIEPGPLGDAVNVTPILESEPNPPAKERVVVTRGGDDLARVLVALGESDASAQMASALYRRDIGSAFTGGERLVLRADAAAQAEGGGASRIDVMRDGKIVWSAARADDGGFASLNASDQAASAPPAEAGEASDLAPSADESLSDSLYGLVQARGVERSLIDQIVRLCAHDFDPDRPVGKADRIEFLSSAGDLNQSELRFVRLTAQGKTRSYYRYAAPQEGGADFYDRDGRSVTKFLLRNPVPGGRLNDGFGWRFHPVLKIRRFHEGVDFDAPLGSRVEAAGGGVVEKIDQESGYGKYIRIRHDLGYETTYAHVSSFPRAIKVGTRVRQGDVIAYVGSTGYSTGPHLYYEVKINGRNVDPMKIRLSDGRILAGQELALFIQRRDRTDRLLDASRTTAGGG